ncbi:MAG: helix-turn-helix domain-containing protein [Acutalibacteraceae bacterium]|nr:helix-turn-helix domain-containing protein [Acutalibacteraceae bacterium]
MERNFPVIISELRKEKGLSQKEAAAQLGISQALLSHYEKGIRECGQSFLIRIAEFYGVSCDYILGRTNKRSDIQAVAENLLETNNDFEATSRTYIKAAMILRDALNGCENLSGLQLDMVLATGIYRLLLIEAYVGNIPKNWVGRAYVNGEVICNPTYLNIIDAATYDAFNIKVSKNPMPDKPTPEAVETLVKNVENFIFSSVSESMPPIPLEFIK